MEAKNIYIYIIFLLQVYGSSFKEERDDSVELKGDNEQDEERSINMNKEEMEMSKYEEECDLKEMNHDTKDPLHITEPHLPESLNRSYEGNQECELNPCFATYSDEKLFKCSKCSFETNYKSALKVHDLNHSETKLFNLSHTQTNINLSHTHK